jgi:hypothetical protein
MKKQRLTPPQALSVRPVHLVEATIEKNAGGGTLKVPIQPARWTGWFFKMPEGATKTFELDALGLLVWESCDGKTSVQQIIRRLAKQYNLNLREAEVPTVKFLQMLVKKGLIGMPVKEEKG